MGHKSYVHFGEFCLLDALVKEDGPMKLVELAAVTGYAKHYVYSPLARSLVKNDLVERKFHGVYEITEAGRIVHALKAAGMELKRLRQRSRKLEADLLPRHELAT